MTTAICRKIDGHIEVAADTYLKGGFKGIDYGDKIHIFPNDDVVVFAGNYIPSEMIEYYQLEPNPVAIKEFCTTHNPDGECLYVNARTLQMFFISPTIIQEYYDFISIGSGYQAAYIQWLKDNNIHIEEMFEYISLVDPRTNGDVNSIIITQGNNKKH